MSAVFGLVRWRSRAVQAHELERMSSALTAHGTQGAHTVVAGSAGMGQRLLQLTPQDAFERQPIEQGDRVLVADARLDDRETLVQRPGFLQADWLQALLDGREPLEVLPDSALILRAVELWGAACVDYLCGTWAFAVWNRATSTLLAARSPVTAPQLLFHVGPGQLAFATAARALHALDGIPRRLNEARMADFIAQTGHDRSVTFFEDIRRLPSGHLLEADADGVRVRAYWSEAPRRLLNFANDDACRDAFLALFDRVVADYCRSSSPLASHLSGGLDSSSIAVSAARQLQSRGERLQTYTEVPTLQVVHGLRPHEYADESELVAAITAVCPTLDTERVQTGQTLFLEGLDALFDHMEAPVRNAANSVWINTINRLAAARGQRVLLTGQQGNLTMSYAGSPQCTPVRALLAGARGWWRRLRQDRALARWQARYAALLAPAFAEQCRQRGWLAGPSSPPVPGRDGRAVALVDQDMGGYVSAMRAQWGIDLRLPATDRRLVEFCLAVPPEQFCLQGVPRSLIRRAMQGRLPAQVLDNHRRGRQAADWLLRLGHARARVLQEVDRLQQSPLARRLLDLAHLQQLAQALPAAGTPADKGQEAAAEVLQHGLMAGRFLCWFEAGETP